MNTIRLSADAKRYKVGLGEVESNWRDVPGDKTTVICEGPMQISSTRSKGEPFIECFVKR